MLEVRTTEDFDVWLAGLDQRSQVRIGARLAKLARGLWGDCKPVAQHLVELREHFGPGYRIYVTPVGNTLVIALGGGGKSSQRADIARAAKLAQLAQE